VTFAAGQQHLAAIGLDAGGYMAAVLALMETPAILTALILMGGAGADKPVDRGLVLREVLVGAASMMLLGGFAVGAISGQAGYERLELFVGPLFQGALCFFLLDLGLIAARGLMNGAHKLSGRVVTFALLFPMSRPASPWVWPGSPGWRLEMPRCWPCWPGRRPTSPYRRPCGWRLPRPIRACS
jgi:hypothetical protein